jgi:hypothetical protein
MKKLFTIGVFFICAALAGVAAAQEGVTRKTVNVSGFNAIDASGVANVFLTRGDQEKVEVEMNEKYRQYAKVTVVDRVLKINLDLKDRDGKRDYDDLKFRVYVTYTSMKELKGSGATNFTTRNKLVTPSLEVDVSGANNSELEVETGELSIDASGAANIKLTGKADELEIDVSGACNIKAYELNAGRVDAEVSGVSNVDVTAQKKLDVKASGLSHVNYKGSPQIGVREVSKMSSLKKH